ncbi:MAG: 4'-phosphopantetheinyl transferase superfamily protein [Anaerolineae bacterium]|nr:4'-phosphopantetheinyl transferase superfamily protein [Anaerolineae bacterium]
MIYWHLCAAADAPAQGFLSAAERRTVEGLRFPKRREEWLLGRWTAKELLRLSIPAYESLPPGAISVCNDPDGAPYLSLEGEGRLTASLSISHRAGCAFCALSPATSPAIGADVEQVEPRAAAFVTDFFTAGEAERVWACAPATRDTLVTAIWSAKEAVLKALRHGLRVDTRAVEVQYVDGLDGAAPQDGQEPVHVVLTRVGANASGAAWRTVEVTSQLPGARRIAAWWRPEGERVLTLAAVWP